MNYIGIYTFQHMHTLDEILIDSEIYWAWGAQFTTVQFVQYPLKIVRSSLEIKMLLKYSRLLPFKASYDWELIRHPCFNFIEKK